MDWVGPIAATVAMLILAVCLLNGFFGKLPK